MQYDLLHKVCCPRDKEVYAKVEIVHEIGLVVVILTLVRLMTCPPG